LHPFFVVCRYSPQSKLYRESPKVSLELLGKRRNHQKVLQINGR